MDQELEGRHPIGETLDLDRWRMKKEAWEYVAVVVMVVVAMADIKMESWNGIAGTRDSDDNCENGVVQKRKRKRTRKGKEEKGKKGNLGMS